MLSHEGALSRSVPILEEDSGLDLGVVAYENAHETVFHAWLNLPEGQRQEALRDRYVFYSYTFCVGSHVAGLLRHDFDGANRFVSSVIGHLRFLVNAPIPFTEEWFKGIDKLADDLIKLNFIPEARTLVAMGMRTGVRKFPRLALSLAAQAAYLDALAGRRYKATKVALRLVQRPYLLPSRGNLPALYHRLVFILAAGNYLREYRLLLWAAVSLLNTTDGLRDAFSKQIALTYRGTWRAVLSGDIPFKYRFPILLSRLAGVIAKVDIFRWLGLDKPVRWVHIGFMYFLDRLVHKKNELLREANRAVSGEHHGARSWQDTPRRWRFPRILLGHRKILITRAMGGIGDLLMMTPGLRALAAKYPRAQIDFAIPRSFHPIFEGLPGIRLLDIDEDVIDLSGYKRWINLTDCPAGRIESRQYPNVRRNRIEIFAKAMGISKWRLKSGVGFLPFYQVKDEEREWAGAWLRNMNQEGRPVVGIQPFAADSYRNWPYMEQLVGELARSYCVLLFHHEQLLGFQFENVVKVAEPLRNSIALASLCERLIVPDSSFLHFSAALQIQTVSIFGAVSGRLRTQSYHNVQLLAPNKKEFPCYPCWRHEHKPCHLTNGRESLCLRSIKVEHVLAALKKNKEHWREMPSLTRRMINWIRYGRE